MQEATWKSFKFGKDPDPSPSLDKMFLPDPQASVTIIHAGDVKSS